jgi:SAM-dependent methyltransferase
LATTPSTDNEQVEALRRRVEAQEREHAEQIKRANAALAAAQDRSYWLERWRLDLNELMRRPGASEARAALRGLRALYRVLKKAQYALGEELRALPQRASEAREVVESERAMAEVGEKDPFARLISPDPPYATPVTDLLYERLDESTITEVEGSLTPAEQGVWDAAGPGDRRRLTIAFGVHNELTPVLAATGLRGDTPPPGIHAMERSAESAGGSTYYADMIVAAAAECGFDVGAGKAGLDFGCSSGRVVRVLAAAYPEIEWHGCDPLAPAIDWARDHIPGVAFDRSPQQPPLPYGGGWFDFICAISIWSHFAEQAAIEWLHEMRRVLRPGGRLVLSSHGLQSVADASAQGVRPPEQLEEIELALYRDGFWFTNEFGSEGDHGLHHPAWGTAFFTPEWLLTRTSGAWKVGAYHPGHVQGNQDLYVLEPA